MISFFRCIWLLVIIAVGGCSSITDFSGADNQNSNGDSTVLEPKVLDWQRRARSATWRTPPAEPYLLLEKLSSDYFFGLTDTGSAGLISKTAVSFAELCKLAPGASSAALENKTGLLALAYSTEIQIVSLSDCSKLATLTRLKSRINNIQFHPDDQSIIMAGLDSLVYRWHYLKDTPDVGVKQQALALERYFGHATSVTALGLHYDGRVFFSGDYSGSVFAWRYFDRDRYEGTYDVNRLFGLRGHSEMAMRSVFKTVSASAIEDLEVSESGRYLLVASQSGFIEVRKVRGFKLLNSFEAHRGLIYDLELINEEPLVFASAGRDNYLKVWELVHTPKEAIDYRTELILEKRVEGIRKITKWDATRLLTSSATGGLELINPGASQN